MITKLYGGLGNQMYQYAIGSVLAKKLGTSLRTDLSWFDAIKGNPEVVQRVYELDGFGIVPKEVNYFDRLLLKFNPAIEFKEDKLWYNKKFASLRGNVVLDGYWQSFKYFKGYEDLVAGLFEFPQSNGENQKLLDNISSTESISLHVRRGDYNTKVSRKYHGLMPLGYYRRAMKVIRPEVTNPHIYVFSDEIDWCKENITFKIPTTYVDSNGPNVGAQDMKLMSACKHNIIANSSFSWWAAWLNKNPKKIVCAPENWFAGEEHQIADRIPRNWTLL